MIIPSPLHTYVYMYIYSTYPLQECVCFRKHAHTAPEQQSNTNTEKQQHHIQVHSSKKELVTCIHTDSLSSLYEIPIIQATFNHAIL